MSESVPPAPLPGAGPSTPGMSGPLWSAAAVARHLGIAPATLRSWGQRYGIGPAGHRRGLHRRYTAADVAELDAIRDLVARGVVLSAAAAIVREQRPGALSSTGHRPADRPADEPGAPERPHGAGTRPTTVAGLAAAAARLDEHAITEIITVALDEGGVLAVWDRLCRPAIHQLGESVAEQPGCADSHLILSWSLASCLRRHSTAPGRPAGPARPVLLAGAPGEHHTLPLEVLAAALAEQDTPTRMLGPAVPAVALRHAVRQLHPAAVVVWSQRPATANPGLLGRVSAHTGTVLAAGPGWRGTALPPAVTVIDDPRTALALATSAAHDHPGLRTGSG